MAKTKILIADDDRTTLAYLQFKLKKAGFDVVTASNGREAVESLTEDIGAVLLDLNMPEMNGMECLNYIQENFRDLQTIMITACDEITQAVDAMKYGAFDYIIKPPDPVELINVVNRALRTYEQSKRLREVEVALEKAREDEAIVASKIQQTLLLGQPPDDFKGIQIERLTIASQKIDGDFYDFFKVNEYSLDVVVGDVMGKGIPAALLGAATKNHFLRTLYELTHLYHDKKIPEPAEIVSLVQKKMIGRLEELENFLTLCYARFDMSEYQMSYVDCGHMRTIHYHKNTDQCSLLQGVNMPIGFPETEEFKQMTYSFHPGDIFFFYSDGLTEARNMSGDFYGEERLINAVRIYAASKPREIISRIWEKIVDFSNSKTFSDDFTCVVLKIKK